MVVVVEVVQVVMMLVVLSRQCSTWSDGTGATPFNRQPTLG